MKITRYKRTQRILSFYHNNFGLSPPYKILIDGTFCKAALETKINIREQMPTYLSGPVKLITTQCVIRELELLGPAFYGPKHVASQFFIERCSHQTQKTASDCILEHLTSVKLSKRERKKKRKFDSQKAENNENSPTKTDGNAGISNAEVAKSEMTEKYFVATLDPLLQDSVRASAGNPLLFIQYNCLLIEKPSPSDEDAARLSIDARLNHVTQKGTLKALKEAEGIPTEAVINKRKRKRKGGPNPLSCKKKKVVAAPPRESRKKGRTRHKRKSGVTAVVGE